jgi:hypothetical protein
MDLRTSGIALTEPHMNDAAEAYALPARIEGELARVRDIWRGLLRGGATIPFWDDLQLAALGDDADKVILIDVFEHPRRFRFNFIGRSVANRLGERPVAGVFLDRLDRTEALDHLEAQCAATVEGRAPTYYRHDSRSDADRFERMMLPMWGNGRIDMLLTVVAAPVSNG